MIGLVLSDNFLLCGVWEPKGSDKTLKSLSKIEFPESITNILYNEAELNTILAPSLRMMSEQHAIDGQDVIVIVPDIFLNHSALKIEKDLARDDYWDFIHWVEAKKRKPKDQKQQIFGQVYLPGDETLHICNVPLALSRTLKLSIIELGAIPAWMGPASSMYLDGTGMSEVAMIQRFGNRYTFYKVQNNRFSMGKIGFSAGAPRIIMSTEDDKVTLSSLGLEESELDDIPVFCPQKLGRQAISSWQKSDFRSPEPFSNIDIETYNISNKGIPYYEGSLITQAINCISTDFSFNFFNEPGITEFFFTAVIDANEKRLEKDAEQNGDNILDIVEQVDSDKPIDKIWFLAAVIVIVMGFIGFQYVKLREELNLPIFGKDKTYSIERSKVKRANQIEKSVIKASAKLIQESQAISDALLKLFIQTDLERYNSLTITKNFASMEYNSGINPNIENILELDPTSFSVEPLGTDSTVFSWYYTFDMPDMAAVDHGIVQMSKDDLLKQLDTSLTDYSLKYFDQIFLENQIYEPLLLWARDKSNILQASAILSNSGERILLRKFVLFNSYAQPAPRAGFYLSLLKN
tara:strand:- start:978 stop:2708 length:1731 start_codon:yes stop_codon:yes gene_type:complete